MTAHETQRGSNRRLCDVLEAMPELDPSSCLQLAALSIHTTGELLFYCATSSGRTRIAMAADLRVEQVEDCRIAAELLLVPEMDAYWVPLLRAAGIDSLRDLACRHPTTLTELLSRLHRQPHAGSDRLNHRWAADILRQDNLAHRCPHSKARLPTGAAGAAARKHGGVGCNYAIAAARPDHRDFLDLRFTARAALQQYRSVSLV